MKKINTGKIKLREIKHIANSRLRTTDDVADLMADIEQHGLLEPVGIRMSDKALIFGNRRVKAFQKLGYEEIDCVYFDDVSDEDLLILNLLENIKRNQLNSIEVGRMCKILREERGMTPSEVAIKTGMTKNRVLSSISAFNITAGIPFEKLVSADVRGGVATGRTKIPESLLWKLSLGLTRVFKRKLRREEWNILLSALEEGKLTSHNIHTFRNILLSSEDKNIIKALDILNRTKIVAVIFTFNEVELTKILRKEKLNNGQELIKKVVRDYNPDLFF